MLDVSTLLEWQRQFLDALYDSDRSGPLATILTNGLSPDARMRIYRHSSEAIHCGALRTTYAAVLALVGESYFDQTALGYRRAHCSLSGNLQAFGSQFPTYLETLPELGSLRYLPDVARLEWLRQESALTLGASPSYSDTSKNVFGVDGEKSEVCLHPSLRILASPHPVFTIWRYAMQPGNEQLVLEDEGERVVLWSEHDGVSIALTDPASFACITSLVGGETLDKANTAGLAVDTNFDLNTCLASLLKRGLIYASQPITHPKRRPLNGDTLSFE